MNALASTTRPKAFSYLRFSTPEQMKGDSMRRQSALAVEYAARHGLQLDTELTFNDLGVSAYRAKNAETGALGVFSDLAHDGKIPKGSYLLVESLDRVSRTVPRKAVRILERICEAGINVVTLSDGKVYNEENLDNDGGMSLIMSVLIFVRANEESVTKSKRVRAAWDAKRATAGSKPLTAACPAWLKLDKETGTFSFVEEKAEVVRQIFQLAAQGWGLARIATHLTRTNVAPLSTKGRTCAYWNHGSVRYILNSRAAIGEHVPCVTGHKDGKQTRQWLEPIKGYYPAVIEQDVWDQVHTVIAQPKQGRWGLTNIFAGLMICSRCGASMAKQSRTVPGGKRYTYVICSSARVGGGCKFTGVNLDNVEAGFMRDLGYILSGKPTSTGADEKRLEVVEYACGEQEKKIAQLRAAYVRVADPAWLDLMAPRVEELKVLRAEQKALIANIAAASGPLADRRTEGLKEALAEEPRDVQKINAHMRALFTGLTINPDAGVCTLGWAGGGETRFVFAPPADQRPKPRGRVQKA